jgi:lysyl-tRNA synthetase class 2
VAKNRILADRRMALTARSAIISEIRRFFLNRDYLEVETPLLIPAPAPELHIDAIAAGSWFLHTSPELCMKRLLAAGYERIFQICRCWRQGERGRKHLPEFSMLEWYTAGCDYRDLMEECEELVRKISQALGKGNSLTFRDQHINLDGPWERITVREAFLRYGAISMEEALLSDVFDEVMVEDIEPRLGIAKPTLFTIIRLNGEPWHDLGKMILA